MEVQLINRIQNAIDFIEDNLYEKIEIEDVARTAFMSLSSFYTVFSSLLGTTVKDYIRKRRLSMSSYELVNSDLSVLDIALKYQYNTYESYSRAFKKLFGISPQNYREKNLYTNVFPRITLIYNDLSGGNYMVSREMNKDIVFEKINAVSNGYVLDIDIDHFDSVNKNYGHDIGDKLLVEVPERIKKVLIKHNLNVDVTRIKNDEFAVIIKDQSKAFIEKLSEDIINAMADKFVFDDLSFHATVSIGISNFSVEYNNEEIIKNANDAMLLAKENGRNQYKLFK